MKKIDVGHRVSERYLIDVTPVAQQDHRKTLVGKTRQVRMVSREIAAVFDHT